MSKVSVIMSTYKESAAQLRAAVDSILVQTYRDFKFIIVVDNPENEEHIAILNKYVENDDRIKLFVNEQNKGLTYCRNFAIEKCDSEYIALMDADDISDKTRLATQVAYLDTHSGVSVVCSGRIEIDEAGKEIGKSSYNFRGVDFPKVLKHGSFITNPTTMIRRYEILDGYREIKHAEDYDLWLRMMSRDKRFHMISKPLLYYRMREDSLSRASFADTWVASQYVRSLFAERKNGKYDSFSPKHYEDFKKKSILATPERVAKFNEVYGVFCDKVELVKKNSGIKKLFSKEFYAGFFGMIGCFFRDGEVFKVFKNFYATKKALNKAKARARKKR